MAWLQFAKEQPHFWEMVSWTDEVKINLYQSDRKTKVWRRAGTTQDPKHTTPSVKRCSGGVMAWVCMAAEGTGSLIFIDITADGRSKIHSKV